jgi:hypothetical protein
MPIGYPADCEGAQYMKYKDFIALRNLTDEEVLNADFAEKASLDIQNLHSIQPLYQRYTDTGGLNQIFLATYTSGRRGAIHHLICLGEV